MDRFRLFFLIAPFLAYSVAYGQNLAPAPVNLNFEHVPIPNKTVISLTQDQYGFIWIGTFDGLFRYDGYEITVYRHDPEDSTSISNNWIDGDIYEDRLGRLWIGTSGGVNRFDRASNTFVKYVHDAADSTTISHDFARVIAEDRSGTLWFGTRSGLNRFDESTQSFTRYIHDESDPTSLSHDVVSAIYEDSYGRLWIGTGGDSAPSGEAGVNLFDPQTGTFTRYGSRDANAASAMDNRVWYIGEVNQDELIIGTCDAGLHVYDVEGDVFRPILMNHLAKYPAFFDAESGPCIVDVFQDTTDAKAIWIAAANGGLSRLEADFTGLRHFLHDPSDSNSLLHNRVLQVEGDRMGMLWVGTLEGLSKIDPTFGVFQTYRHYPGDGATLSHEEAYVVFEDDREQLWVGTPNGLNRMDRDRGAFERISINATGSQALASNSIKTVFEDRRGALWIGATEGLGIFDETTRQLDILFPDLDIAGFAINHTDWPMIEDRRGILWVGTSNGLYEIDPVAKKLLNHFQHNPEVSSSLSASNIRTLHESDDGAIWVGTYGGGLNRLDIDTREFRHYLPGRLITHLRRKAKGQLWIASFTGGLFMLDYEGDSLRQYTTHDGLPSNEIAAIQEDDEGFIWLSSANGISRIDPAQETFKNFDAHDGQQEGRYNWASAFKSKRGEIFFGGGKGLTSFFPSKLNDNPFPPQIVLTDIRIFNESLGLGDDSPLDRDILMTDRIELPHSKNELSLEFAGLHYKQSDKNTYAYWLEGYNQDWQQVGAQRVAHFTNLNPGAYAFHVKSANSDGIWGDVRSLSITIYPPWWKTGWAYLIYLMLTAAAIFGIDRYQRRKLIQKERLRAEREKARAIEATNNELKRTLKHLTETQNQLIHAEKMASLGQLTAGIAHEIKNPLNFVNNFSKLSAGVLEELKDWIEVQGGMMDDEVRELVETLEMNAEKIQLHGERADGIVKAMLDHSRTGRGERTTVAINRHVEEFLNLTYHGARARLEDFTADIERDFGEDVGDVEIYPQEIGRVVINLLDNAFYAVHEKRLSSNGLRYAPQVRIGTKREDGYVEIQVEDNGPGMTEEIAAKIFDPFYTTKPAGSGTGLGLSLSHEIIVKGHGGSLTVDTEVGKGTVFTLSLPA